MKEIFIKWGFTDEYGRADEDNARYEWVETMEQADEFIANKKARNGGYFKLWKVAKGNKAEFDRMVELRKELLKLEKKF